MLNNMHKTILILIIVLLLPACSQPHEGQSDLPFIKGIYGNPGTLLEAGYSFDSLGLNAVFVRSISLTREFFDTARDQGCRVYVEFPTLLGRNYVDDNPEAWPIDEKGLQSPAADWFMGVCPTNSGFRDYRITQLRDILENYEIDGIFLDYVHWHAQFETPDPILPETCFCNNCTSLFEAEYNLDIPGVDISEKASWILEQKDTEWRRWRSDVLSGWVRDLGEEVKNIRPDALLGIFYCSWYADDHDNALYRILGIDLAEFVNLADVLSPMLFHMMKDRPVGWVGEYLARLGRFTGDLESQSPEIWPIVQAHNNPGTISPEEFRQVMVEGSKPPSTGIMMFSDQSLLQDQKKIEVMKELYSVW
jgi:hypothetical protein